MTETVHPMAPHHLPGFLPGADGSDWLFTVVAVMMVILLMLLGSLYLTLHALPERLAHKSNATQFQLIGVLALLALFTHNNIFWVVALLLASLRVPDFMTPLQSISASLEDIKEQGRRNA